MKLKCIGQIAAVMVLIITGCSMLSFQPPSDILVSTDNLTSHTRKMHTPAYSGNKGAVIFVLNHVEDGNLIAVTDRILRVFAESGVPVDVAVPTNSPVKHPELLNFLRDYVDAGIIDISISGADISWVDVDSTNIQDAVAGVEERLTSARTWIDRYFGVRAAACVFPYEFLNQHNYQCLIDAGFKIISTIMSEDFSASRQMVSWNASVDPEGLIRLSIVGTVNYRGAADMQKVDQGMIDLVKITIDRSGIAVIEIDPAYFLSENNQIDTAKIQQLGSLVESAKSLGEIVTFDGWNRYATEYITVTPIKRIMPVYNGGTAIIFRMDDVCKGWYEDADREIINVFRNNGVPLDCGVISNADGANSYDIPWLKDYLIDGVVGISVHGFDWTYYQMDTSKSNLTYGFIKWKLIKARNDYLKYYGFSPVSITIPTDYYDEIGYSAIADAGFKVFSTQMLIEPHPSIQQVDYYGRVSKGGLYRIPTGEDVCLWDKELDRFKEVIDVSRFSAIHADCKNYQSDPGSGAHNVFYYSICSIINSLDVAAVGIHPTCLLDDKGQPDSEGLDKLDAIVKWAKKIGTVTTFEQWYRHTSRTQSQQ